MSLILCVISKEEQYVHFSLFPLVSNFYFSFGMFYVENHYAENQFEPQLSLLCDIITLFIMTGIFFFCF